MRELLPLEVRRTFHPGIFIVIFAIPHGNAEIAYDFSLLRLVISNVLPSGTAHLHGDSDITQASPETLPIEASIPTAANSSTPARFIPAIAE